MHSPPTHLITETKPFFLIPSWRQPESSALPEHLKGEGERGEQSTRLGERWIHKVVDTYGGNVRSREGDNCVGGGTVFSWLPSDQIGSKIFPARRESGNKKCARGWGNGGTFCTRMPWCCTTWCGEKTGNQTERGNWTALKKSVSKEWGESKNPIIVSISYLFPNTLAHTYTKKEICSRDCHPAGRHTPTSDEQHGSGRTIAHRCSSTCCAMTQVFWGTQQVGAHTYLHIQNR